MENWKLLCFCLDGTVNEKNTAHSLQYLKKDPDVSTQSFQLVDNDEEDT